MAREIRRRRKWTRFHAPLKRSYIVINLLDATLTAKSAGGADRKIVKMLNHYGKKGFKVVGVAFGNKVLLEKVL